MYVTLCNAIIPFYDTQGANMTYTISEDGTRETHPFSAKKFLNNLLGEFSLDPKMLRKWSSGVLYSKTQMPIICMVDQVFIPVKIRISLGKHDGCFGCILTSAIASYSDYKMTLPNDQVLDTLPSDSYINNKLRAVKLLNYSYIEQKALMILCVLALSETTKKDTPCKSFPLPRISFDLVFAMFFKHITKLCNGTC